jgi:hypothetical protein
MPAKKNSSSHQKQQCKKYRNKRLKNGTIKRVCKAWVPKKPKSMKRNTKKKNTKKKSHNHFSLGLGLRKKHMKKGKTGSYYLPGYNQAFDMNDEDYD